MAETRLCSIPNCDKPHSAKGFCLSHYLRWRTYGDPLAGGAARGEALRYFKDAVLTYNGDECLIWPFSTNGGYGQLRYKGRPRLVSRLVCEALYGPAPSREHHAAHSCGNGSGGCVSPLHLSWKTPIDNEADKISHGTSPRGENCGAAKLSVLQVKAIRALKGHLTQHEIGTLFGVKRGAIKAIHNGRTWVHF